jgi:hypothetical protein
MRRKPTSRPRKSQAHDVAFKLGQDLAYHRLLSSFPSQSQRADDPYRAFMDGVREADIIRQALEPSWPPAAHNRRSPQFERVHRAVLKLYGTTDLPRHISTDEVRGRVGTELDPESKRLRLANPSWHTVNRVIGRE